MWELHAPRPQEVVGGPRRSKDAPRSRGPLGPLFRPVGRHAHARGNLFRATVRVPKNMQDFESNDFATTLAMREASDRHAHSSSSARRLPHSANQEALRRVALPSVHNVQGFRYGFDRLFEKRGRIVHDQAAAIGSSSPALPLWRTLRRYRDRARVSASFFM